MPQLMSIPIKIFTTLRFNHHSIVIWLSSDSWLNEIQLLMHFQHKMVSQLAQVYNYILMIYKVKKRELRATPQQKVKRNTATGNFSYVVYWKPKFSVQHHTEVEIKQHAEVKVHLPFKCTTINIFSAALAYSPLCFVKLYKLKWSICTRMYSARIVVQPYSGSHSHYTLFEVKFKVQK